MTKISLKPSWNPRDFGGLGKVFPWRHIRIRKAENDFRITIFIDKLFKYSEHHIVHRLQYLVWSDEIKKNRSHLLLPFRKAPFVTFLAFIVNIQLWVENVLRTYYITKRHIRKLIFTISFSAVLTLLFKKAWQKSLFKKKKKKTKKRLNSFSLFFGSPGEPYSVYQ